MQEQQLPDTHKRSFQPARARASRSLTHQIDYVRILVLPTMGHSDDDSSSSIFAPSPAPNKFQTFLFGGVSSSSPPRFARRHSANREQPRKLFRRPPRPGLTSVYASYQQPRESATASTQLAMTIEIPSDPQQGIIKPVHINTDETPWTFSVSANDAASFSIYVKSELIQMLR